ncbi:MAG: LL-diaminopimelate aminotransferase [Methanosarcinales archaeon]|nr:LL-diaminopimelate aminotransferase [Methanosarcinales archaeon]
MYSDRINKLPPYLFAAIDEAKEKIIKKGIDVIDLGVGDPDMPTPDHIIQALYRSAKNPKRHRYPSYIGMLSFREAAAKWYKDHFDIDLDPVTQVLALIGSKEGLAHAPLAFLNSGDIALVPDPAYPVYKIGVLFADARPYSMPLLEKNGFIPDLKAIPKDIVKQTRLMFLNYPNNPTSATVPEGFFNEVVEFARENDIIVIHDNAYSEMTYDGNIAPSFLQADGAMDVGVEFHSLSKTYNMTGWRIGFAVGNAQIISGLGKIKTNVDSGAFEAIQEAGITAMQGPQDCINEMREIYTQRRDALMVGLKGLGIKVQPPKATFYIWAPVPKGYDSTAFSKLLLEEAGIVATPGIGFGDYGEGYIRFALTQSVDRINEAVKRMEQLTI